MLKCYSYQRKDDYSFEFSTTQNLVYKVYFLDYSFMFSGYDLLQSNVLSLNIDVISGNPDLSANDEKVGMTIALILKVFFEDNKNVAIYVCDNLDERHIARKRKFDLWFWLYNDGEFLKEDGLAVIDGAEIYSSIIIHRQNPELIQLIMAFNDLNSKANEK